MNEGYKPVIMKDGMPGEKQRPPQLRPVWLAGAFACLLVSGCHIGPKYKVPAIQTPPPAYKEAPAAIKTRKAIGAQRILDIMRCPRSGTL